jgi:hypothetical protein
VNSTNQPPQPATHTPPHETHEPAQHLEIKHATPADSDARDASAHAPVEARIGERRTIVEMLIENAKLIAQLDGKDAVIESKNETIGELKDDRNFIREELVDRRKYSSDADR